MDATQHFFSNLLDTAAASFHRYGVVLNGDQDWQLEIVRWLAEQINEHAVFQLGGEKASFVDQAVKYNKGQQLLGQECGLLVCDLRDMFDANSFSAALGCVIGGGLVLILPSQSHTGRPEQIWLERALNHLIQVNQNQSLPQPPTAHVFSQDVFHQQAVAVEKIRKVVEGHRKRPLVMTADRGRGKSSALGIAAAQLIQSRTIHILVCAPTLATVQPIFEHAARILDHAEVAKGVLRFGPSVIEFIAPDELLKRKPKCDCLFVDEASALPIPMLQQMVEHYHRTVFSTTVHGYEGCGRGFSVKFQSWLQEHRPGTQEYTLSQPIRWAENDPLENWLFNSFLLDADLQTIQVSTHQTQLGRLSKRSLIDAPHILRACFALLVNAHYQTAPSDLMLLLADDAIDLYATFEGDVCIGCILTVEEGGLDSSLVAQIQQGNRRPKGHLVATTLAGQVGIGEAAAQSSLRVMRIAVHPALQGQGIGQAMLRQLQNSTDYDFYSTSFGATSELVHFWSRCDFVPIKLGSSRDQASGTHSLIMVSRHPVWLDLAREYYRLFIRYSLSGIFQKLEIDLVRSLTQHLDASVDKSGFESLIQTYLSGGASYDSVAPILDSWWKASPSVIGYMSDLVVTKIVQQAEWRDCADRFQLSGRKQAELQFKLELSNAMTLAKMS